MKMLEKRRIAETQKQLGRALQMAGQDIANAQRDARADGSTEMIALYATLSAELGYAFITLMSKLIEDPYNVPVMGLDEWARTYTAYHSADWDGSLRSRWDYLMAEYGKEIERLQSAAIRAGDDPETPDYFTQFIRAEQEDDDNE